MIKKPPWNTVDEHTRAWMRTWVFEQLELDVTADERALDVSVRQLASLPPATQREVLRKLGLPVAKARRLYGDAGPLRKLYPEIDDAITPPRDWRQRRRRRDQAIKRRLLELAVRDVHRIRELFRQNYGGRWRRHARPTDVEMAAERWGISAGEVREALKRGYLS